MWLCTAYLVLVLLFGGLKFVLNVYKGQVGERMLRRLRYLLFSRILRFPQAQFRKTSQGETIAMITAEVEPLGGFIGDALALPAFQGGMLVTALAFMFVQDWLLGVAAIALYPIQLYVIPKLQRQVNTLAKERVRTVRRLSERIGETVSGIQEVHAHDTSERERAEFSHWVATIYEIRFKIYKKKFFMKFLNNFIAQLTPFFFFSIGGYLVIQGQITFGSLVAVLAAYKDLTPPWKELLRWYQQKEDTRVKYEQLIEQFQPADMLNESLQTMAEGDVPHLDGRVVASNLSFEDGPIKVVDGVSFAFDVGEIAAVIGPGGSGRGAVTRLLARIDMPSGGSIHIGDANLATLPEAVTGRRIAYVGSNVALRSGSVRDNLLYVLGHQPLADAAVDDEGVSARQHFIHEAEESGNTASDIAADWTDYPAAGADGPDSLIERIVSVLGVVGLDQDVFELGLQGTVDPDRSPDLAAAILGARATLRERLEEPLYRDLVEPFDRDHYNTNMSVAENLLFGTPIGPEFDLDHVGENAYVLSVLRDANLLDAFLSTGIQVATITVELFRDLPPGHEFFERFSFVSADALPEFEAAVRRADVAGPEGLEEADRNLLMSLPFKLVPARHRLGVLDEGMRTRILEARHAFAAGLPENPRGSVAFFDAERYNAAASVQDNILFGKPAYGRQQSQRRVAALIGEVVDALGLRRVLVEVGLDYAVGVGGSRLSLVQRQKLGVARAVLKRPDLLVIDRATASLDRVSHGAILDRVLGEPGRGGVVWVLDDPGEAASFDHVITMEAGKIVSQESPHESAKAAQTPAQDGGSVESAAGE